MPATAPEASLSHSQTGMSRAQPLITSPASPHRPGRSSSPRLYSTANRPSSVTSASPNQTSIRSPNPDPIDSYFQAPPRRQNLHPPRQWPEDDISLPSLSSSQTLAQLAGWPVVLWDNFLSDGSNISGGEQRPSEERLLSELANNEFSSPSAYPSFTTHSPLGTISQTSENLHSHLRQSPGLRAASFRSSHQLDLSRSTSDLTSVSSTSRHSLNHGDSQPSTFTNSPSTSFSSDSMPPATRRRSAAAADARSRPAKRQRTSETPKTKRRKTTTLNATINSDAFASEDEKVVQLDQKAEEMLTIDLTDPAKEKDKVEEAQSKPQETGDSKQIRLGNFMCAICMDDVTDLTVTHCGHCFCATCLHQSLYAETTRHRCPMCRTKIDMKPRGSYTTKTKGFFPLELKLMTSTRRGKQKEG